MLALLLIVTSLFLLFCLSLFNFCYFVKYTSLFPLGKKGGVLVFSIIFDVEHFLASWPIMAPWPYLCIFRLSFPLVLVF